MAFEIKLSTDEIRNIMFDFIKPVISDPWDTGIKHIDWRYGVYDENSGFFITYVSTDGKNDKFILITENGDAFYVLAARYEYAISEMPEELKQHSKVIEEGIKAYSNRRQNAFFAFCLSDEQKERLCEITENMLDKCKRSFEISSYRDAERLFYQEELNYNRIVGMYNKSTIASFDKYMTAEKMSAIIGRKYRTIIYEIATCNGTLNEEDYKRIAAGFGDASFYIEKCMDDMYAKLTFEAIKKAYRYGAISRGYVSFIDTYIQSCIKFFPDRIQELREIHDFINENMRSDDFKRLEFCRRELDKLIYKKEEGFRFVCTTDELREKMFDFLKPEYRSENDIYVVNINWTTGVYEKESGIFLTEIMYVPEIIARCGANFYTYIVIADDGEVFTVENNYEYEKRGYDFKIPEQYKAFSDKVKEAIEIYQYRYEYKESLSEDMQGKLKAIKDSMNDRCRRDFSINCEDDAYRLFLQVGFNIKYMLEIYNSRTINAFKKYATFEKLMAWSDK